MECKVSQVAGVYLISHDGLTSNQASDLALRRHRILRKLRSFWNVREGVRISSGQ